MLWFNGFLTEGKQATVSYIPNSNNHWLNISISITITITIAITEKWSGNLTNRTGSTIPNMYIKDYCDR